MVKLVALVLEQPVPSPRQFRPDLPRALCAVVQRCLEKQPGERFKSYDELRQALAPFRSEAPAPAPLGLRFAAGIVDSMLLGAVGTIIGLTFGFGFSSFLDVASQFSPRFFRAIATGFCAMLGYYTVLEGLWGATAGKALCRLRVARPNRNPPGLAKSFARACIYLLLPALPYWIAFGFNPYRFMAQSDHVAANAINLIYYALLASLFITARRHNGFAALQDLLTGTRVIRKPAYQARPVLSAPEVTPTFTPSQPTLGPYHVLETLDNNSGWRMAAGLRHPPPAPNLAPQSSRRNPTRPTLASQPGTRRPPALDHRPAFARGELGRLRSRYRKLAGESRRAGSSLERSPLLAHGPGGGTGSRPEGRHHAGHAGSGPGVDHLRWPREVARLSLLQG